jgi:cell division GTPase FtsZ
MADRFERLAVCAVRRVSAQALTAVIRAIADLLRDEHTIPCVDLVDLRHVLVDAGCAVSGQGEAEGPGRAIRAADAALADLRRQLREMKEEGFSGERFFP